MWNTQELERLLKVTRGVSADCGRCVGLMVSVVVSGSRSLGSSPRWGTVLCSWARQFTLIVPLAPLRCVNGYQCSNAMLECNPAVD